MNTLSDLIREAVSQLPKKWVENLNSCEVRIGAARRLTGQFGGIDTVPLEEQVRYLFEKCHDEEVRTRAKFALGWLLQSSFSTGLNNLHRELVSELVASGHLPLRSAN